MSTEYPYLGIASRLRWHRELLGMNQTDYAASIGVRRTSYVNWETGYQRASLNGGLLLREIHGLSLDFIFAGSADTLPMNLRKAWSERLRDSASK